MIFFKKRIFYIKWVGAETLKEYETTLFVRNKYKAIKFLFKKYKVRKILTITEDKRF